MKIRLNGAPTEVAGDCTVGRIVDDLGRGRGGIAVAVNEEVVPRSRWDTTPLAADDRVEVLTAAQGG